MSPPHLGHLEVIRQALLIAKYVLIIIGSANAARRVDYVPFTAEERMNMVLGMLTPDERMRVRFHFVEDQGNMPRWTSEVQRGVDLVFNSNVPDGKDITLIGHAKDKSSFYLKAFPDWESQDVENFLGLSSTTFREDFFDNVNSLTFKRGVLPESIAAKWNEALHPEVIAWLLDFAQTEYYLTLVADARYNRQMKDLWSGAPYPPVFVTVDAVVMQAGKVLMIRRGGYPGNGQLALPGGFIEQDERVEDGIFRELIEETGLKVPMHILKRSLKAVRYFDNPWRSSRGRTITFAGLIHLTPEPAAGETDIKKIKAAIALPRVKGQDDALKAFWIDIDDVRRDECFEDHYTILHTLIDMIKDGDK